MVLDCVTDLVCCDTDRCDAAAAVNTFGEVEGLVAWVVVVCERACDSIDGHGSHSVECEEHTCNTVCCDASPGWNLAVLVESGLNA